MLNSFFAQIADTPGDILPGNVAERTQPSWTMGTNQEEEPDGCPQECAISNLSPKKEGEDGTALDQAGWVSVFRSADGMGLKILEWL